MNRILHRVLSAGILSAGAWMYGADAQVLVGRPVITATGPVKPAAISRVRPLTQDELQARMQPAPRYVNVTALKAYTYANTPAQQLPDLRAAFSLTPAVQSVPGRGSMRITADVNVPNPLPPGFPGQATLRYYSFRLATGGGPFGTVDLTIKAQKSLFYAVDCLTTINPVEAKVEYSISGSDSAQSGSAAVNNGHLTFLVRRSASDGDIRINFHPEPLEQVKALTSQTTYDRNVMEFWGCQISTSG